MTKQGIIRALEKEIGILETEARLQAADHKREVCVLQGRIATLTQALHDYQGVIGVLVAAKDTTKPAQVNALFKERE